ncbi:MAG: hypothetical protein U1E17_00015 [Geminicoccaceae bacterium]
MTAVAPLSRLGRSFMIVRSARNTLECLRTSLAEAEDGRGSWLQDLEHADVLLAAVLDLLTGETANAAELEERGVRFIAITTRVLRKIDLPSGEGGDGTRRLSDWCLLLEAVALLSITEEELVRLGAAARGAGAESLPPRRAWPVGNVADVRSELGRIAQVLDQARERFAAVGSFASPRVSRAGAGAELDAIGALLYVAHGAAERLGDDLERLETGRIPAE